MHRSLRIFVTALLIATASPLVASCADEENAGDFVVLRASRDGTLSTIILIVDETIDPETAQVKILDGDSDEDLIPDYNDDDCDGDGIPDNLENVRDVTCGAIIPQCVGDEENKISCLFSTNRQVTVTAVKPGTITVEALLNNARGVIRLVDMRPETTAVVFLEKQQQRLVLKTHRRISETFDDFDNNGQWIVEELN